MSNKKVEIYSPDGDLVYPKTIAENVLITDVSGLITATDLEMALKEIVENIEKINTSFGGTVIVVGVTQPSNPLNGNIWIQTF
jgi:SepF-like predicted cell division protein (DUF552 family)